MNSRIKKIEKIIKLMSEEKLFMIPILVERWGERYFVGGYPDIPLRELTLAESSQIQSGVGPRPIVTEIYDDPALRNL